MKKSKIIIPALGMLILSTAASVTGTVAWFTTVSSATANITSFAVRKLGGDLDYTVAAGTGTEKVESSNPKSAIQLTGSNPAMCDASYNHSTGVVWKANSNASAFSSLAAETDWDVEGTDASSNPTVTYYAVSWSYTFTYTFGGDSTAMNLYFDSQSSTVTPTQTAANTLGNSLKTYLGFRIAFVNGGRKVVWAKSQSSANCHYVTATDTATGAYSNVDSSSAAGDLLDSTGLAIVPENNNGTQTRADFLGQFTPAAPTISVKCVAWFEGTDPNVINGSEMDSVAAALTFYTRPQSA